jgi:hypothetical protein
MTRFIGILKRDEEIKITPSCLASANGWIVLPFTAMD